MKVSARVFYACGIVGGLLNAVGGVWLIAQGAYLSLLFNVASIAAGFMMIMLAAQAQESLLRYTALAGAVLCLLGFSGAASGVMGVLGKVAGAAAWPVFAYPYLARAEQESPRRTAAGLVIFTGVIQLAGSFLVLPQMVRSVLVVAIGAVQCLLAWVLYRETPAQQP